VTITRKRHAFEGRALAVIGIIRQRGIRYLLTVLPDGSRSFVPASWTDWKVEPLGGTPAIEADDAVHELGRLVICSTCASWSTLSASGVPSRRRAGRAAMQLNLEFFDQPDVQLTAPVAWNKSTKPLAWRQSRFWRASSHACFRTARRWRQAMNERVKITLGRLAREAVVYLRQSSAAQVEHNRESTERQYALVGKARDLGWPDDRIIVIDEDLGLSGSGAVARSGLPAPPPKWRSRASVWCLVSKSSRLARNNAEWYRLIDLAGFTDTLIGDADGIYHPAVFNDRLLLGLKGTMSEAELHVLRARLKDPDRRIQDGILLVFRKFAELQSIRQVLLWLRQENVLVPAIVQGRGKRAVEWKAAVYHTLHHMLTNPVYAGSYAYGRRGTRVTSKDGRKRIMRDTLRRNWRDWDVLIHDHHEGYLAWAEFERNQHLIADNANGKSYMGRGSIRRGEALLPGLFRCARCGRRLHIQYTGKGGNTQRYACRGRSAPKRPTAVSALAACGSIASSPTRCSIDCSLLGLKQRWPRWKPRACIIATSANTSRTQSSTLNTKPLGHGDSTTPSIPITAWLPVSWSGAGTRSWFNCATWRSSSRLSNRRNMLQRFPPRIARD